MNDQEPMTKISAQLEAKLNLGDFNNAKLSLWIEDRVRPTDASTGAALDRLVNLLDAKLENWAKGLQNDPGTE
jgi:hypothetical protein